ncbi:MAG: alpha/beta fold hydrolase [Planctomycetota bacterium]
MPDRLPELSTLWTLGLVMAATLAVLLLTLLWANLRLLLRPPRMDDARALRRLGRLTPNDVGLNWESMDFVVRGLKLPGWWMPHEGSTKTAVLVHGWAGGKVDVIAWAPLWHALGWNVLAYDQRAHGDADGTLCTHGHEERHDLAAVLGELRSQRPEQSREVALFGVSMGTAIIAAYAAEHNDVDHVVLESPYTSFPDAAYHHGDHFGFPLPGSAPLVMDVAQWRTGADFSELAPLNTIPKITVPLLVMHSTRDPYTPADDAAKLRSAVDAVGGTWADFDALHVAGFAEEPERYGDVLANFLTAKR